MYKYNIGVVIPFYQKEKGILTKALVSIFNQSASDVFFTIIIVDDESPVSATQEFESLDIPNNCKIELISQKNAGPANARNRALEFIQERSIPVVAFIDSDDIWEKTHVSVALKALSDGASFYFCNHKRFDSEKSWFDAIGCFDNWEKVQSEFNIKTTIKEDNVFSLNGKDCFKLFLNDYLSQTSSVVYNFEKFPTLRFDPSLVAAGEDYLLWLELVNESGKVSFSLDSNLYCGEGVNIYFDSFDWKKLASSSKQGYQYLLYFKISQNFKLTKEQSKYISHQQNIFIWRYSYLMTKHLISGKGFNSNLLKSIFLLKPTSALLTPFRFLVAFFDRKKLALEVSG